MYCFIFGFLFLKLVNLNIQAIFLLQPIDDKTVLWSSRDNQYLVLENTTAVVFSRTKYWLSLEDHKTVLSSIGCSKKIA